MYPSHRTARRLALASLISLSSVQAQSRSAALSESQLRQELTLIHDVLTESHVGLHWFISDSALARRFTGIAAGLHSPIDASEWQRRLLPLVASLHHGHTTLERPVSGTGFRLRVVDRTHCILPFQLRILGERLYVVADLSDGATVGAGSEIVSIDGRPTAGLLDSMRARVSADGRNRTFMDYQLDRGYQFHALLDLLHPSARPYRLEVRTRGATRVTQQRAGGITPPVFMQRFRARTGDDVDHFPPPLAYSSPAPHAGVLTVSSFYEGLLPNGSPTYAALLDSLFAQIAHDSISDLIIDIRGNEGGSGDLVALMYSYLADKPFRLASPTTVVSPSLSWIRYAENLSDDVKAFVASPRDFVERRADGPWVLKAQVDEVRHRDHAPQRNAFTGRLIVITDGGAFSATNEFLDLVNRYHRGEGRPVRFIGEPNGGDDASAHVSGGQIVTLRLPYSRLMLRIPLLGFPQFFGTAQPAATIPDERVVPTIDDVLMHRDRALEAALRSAAR